MTNLSSKIVFHQFGKTDRYRTRERKESEPSRAFTFALKRGKGHGLYILHELYADMLNSFGVTVFPGQTVETLQSIDD
jgi:hypothetical protein